MFVFESVVIKCLLYSQQIHTQEWNFNTNV